jgi:hypothetical protein
MRIADYESAHANHKYEYEKHRLQSKFSKSR